MPTFITQAPSGISVAGSTPVEATTGAIVPASSTPVALAPEEVAVTGSTPVNAPSGSIEVED